MKVYLVKDYDTVYGVYATKEKAEQAAKEANHLAACGGHRTWFGVDEYEVK